MTFTDFTPLDDSFPGPTDSADLPLILDAMAAMEQFTLGALAPGGTLHSTGSSNPRIPNGKWPFVLHYPKPPGIQLINAGQGTAPTRPTFGSQVDLLYHIEAFWAFGPMSPDVRAIEAASESWILPIIRAYKLNHNLGKHAGRTVASNSVITSVEWGQSPVIGSDSYYGLVIGHQVMARYYFEEG